MAGKRPERVGDLILDFVSQLLRREIKDPRIAHVTLTAAEVSGDLRHVRLFFTVLTEGEETAEVLTGLRRATGFIRSRVAKDLNFRNAPTLEFIYDESRNQAQRIEELCAG